MLIFPTVVLGLEAVYGRPYGELIALGTASFIAFGVFSLPAGWLADRWSRRNMMALFYFGCGVSLLAAAFSPTLYVLAGALCSARHVRRDLSSGRHGDADRSLAKRAGARSRSTACAEISASRSRPASPPSSRFISAGARPSPFRRIVCLATGIAYLAIVPDDRHHAAQAQVVAGGARQQNARRRRSSDCSS